MPSQRISPWATAAACTSPDGRYRATMAAAEEIHMGAPTSGTLVITDIERDTTIGMYESCNPSVVWSSRSDALAVPEWSRGLRQRLAIIAVPGGEIRRLPSDFSVLELHAFDSGLVRGVESPAHMPRQLEVRVDG